MELEKFRITLGYLNGDMNIPNNKNIISLLDSRVWNLNSPIVIVAICPMELIFESTTCSLGGFDNS